MSFITKRERVFNEYDLFDLPARNEGKLKTYASCTDARAWSHFCSDKSEHLVEVIKRNNETTRTKYIPTDVIVNTLMSAKNAEIGRLKHKIEEFEQMLCAYDQLELTCEQKCDIANAHAAIKAANKELDDMSLDLDLSGFTEGIDSEAFETGKSRGDELSRYSITEEIGKSGRGEIKAHRDEWSFDREKESTPRKETKSSQAGPPCSCDASTSAHDTQVAEMQETIISKDVKLSAMLNTIAVMEHDVCEPYCIYAHIYTALEKIFGTLCQNEKYKQYLDLLTAGKDTRNLDIKGKILFKMKVLEKFSLALIAPCSQEISRASQNCSCFRAEILSTFALTSAENQNPTLDSKRAHLVADIMENYEMKEILSKESLCTNNEDDQLDQCNGIDNCNINVETLNRLKNLQANYHELLLCYDNLRHERDCLLLQCQKIVDLEHECNCLKSNLKEYNQLWKEKEYYKNRSDNLDVLKENYFILSEETSNIEIKLKAEQEINKTKSQIIDQLRNENIKLEQKIGDTSVMFEQQKNVLICKLNECECKMMCQDQQIKSLSDEIVTLLDQHQNKMTSNEDTLRPIQLIDEIESQKGQIENLKEVLCYAEEEKKFHQEDFENKLELINGLKLDVEDWKSRYEEALKGYNYLQMQVDDLQGQNLIMNQELENKASAINNLNGIICSKSHEISNLMETVDHKANENTNLIKEIKNYRDKYDKNITSLMNEKQSIVNSIQIAKQESIEQFEHLKKAFQVTNEIKKNVNNKYDTLNNEDIDNNIVVREIESLRKSSLESINILQCENMQLQKSLDLAKKKSQILKQKLVDHECTLIKVEELKLSQENLLNEKETLQLKLNHSQDELNNLSQDLQFTQKKSDSLLDEYEKIQEEYAKLNIIYKEVLNERNILQKIIYDKKSEMEDLIQSLTIENEHLLLKLQEIPKLQKSLIELQNKYDKLLSEKNILQNNFDIISVDINNLHTILETKIQENQLLEKQLITQQSRELSVNNSNCALKNENYNMQVSVDILRKESAKLVDKIKQYDNLETQYKELEYLHSQLKLENQTLQKDLIYLNKLQEENYEYSATIENALVDSRNETLSKTCSIHDFYTDLIKEVEKLKEEKLKNHQELNNLLEKIDDSEYIITNLNENIYAREKRISTLENYINELQVEIRALQNNLKEVVESGEELKELSYEKLDQCIKKIEAHESKATHNMKIELAKLQNEKENLEDQLSTTIILTEENVKNKYVLQISELQNDRELIVSDIKQLEIKCVGDSNLLPGCCINEVITSLSRIGKYINSKNTSLEQTLLSVQASYQILKSKAEAAKNIAETEQQKILYEKEQTQQEKISMEKYLRNLKDKMKEEKMDYNNIIKDLEGELLNQRLIFNNVKQSKEDQILKLIDENQLIRDHCDNYNTEIKELKHKLHHTSDELSKNIELIDNSNRILEQKDKLLITLQNQLDDISNKITKASGAQTISFVPAKDCVCQTDIYGFDNTTSIDVKTIRKDDYYFPLSSNSIENYTQKYQIVSDIPINPSNTINKTQILTANIAPKFDFDRKVYLNYKQNKLSLGKLEQLSIASFEKTQLFVNNGLSPCDELFSEMNITESASGNNMSNQMNQSVDSVKVIYNKQSFTDSTKIKDINNTNINAKNGRGITIDLEGNNEDLKKENTVFIKNSIQDVNLIKYIESEYKDLLRILEDKETLNVPQKLKQRTSHNKSNQPNDEKTIYIDENISDDSVKPKLNINLPRVINNSYFLITNSDDDKNSLGSLTSSESPNNSKKHPKNLEINFISVPTDKNETKAITQKKITLEQYFGNHYQAKGTDKNSLKNKTVSNHKIRGSAVVLIQNTTIDDLKENFNVKSKYGLQYILDTVQNEINPHFTEKNIKSLHKSHSAERFISVSESSHSKNFSPLKISSLEYATTSTYSPLPSVEPFHVHSVERGTLTKKDYVEDYENKIQQLTKALENIEKQYKSKIEAVKVQYDSNVQSIISEHNHGVKSIQNFHEETLNDIKKIHENEVENLRTMSIEAMRKAEILKIENYCLKSKLNNDAKRHLNEEPIRIPSPDSRKRKCKCRVNSRTLTKTNVEAFNIKPKRRPQGPCTCSLDVNVSDAIRSIFEQVDADQRKMAEQIYLKYIANKILDGNVEILDEQELSFLHFKVCRSWKPKLNKEEALQMKIDYLETEVINKRRKSQKHMAEWDLKVAKERRRLRELQEAVCVSPHDTRAGCPAVRAAEKDVCRSTCDSMTVKERRSADDLASGVIATSCKRKRGKLDTSKAVSTKLNDPGRRRDKGLISDDTPTRLKRAHDRHNTRTHNK